MSVSSFINMRPTHKSDFHPTVSKLKRGRGNSSCLHDIGTQCITSEC